MNKKADKWDLVVIGGGPAGMMAAGTAAQKGLRVLLLEKNESLGKKLLITGGGRCNLTNAELDKRKFLAKFKENDKFLFSAFSKWSVGETLDFFHKHGMETRVENFGRVFPKSDKAESVFNVLVDYIKNGKVEIKTGAEVTGFEKEEGKIICVNLKNKEKIFAENFVLATGGKSRPETGSTGDGFVWLKKIGHMVVDPEPSLVPIETKDDWVKQMQGITLNDIKITVFQNNQKQDSKTGRILFTHFGLSGPTILNMSKDIGELLKYGEVEISLDVTPKMAHDQLNKALQESFEKNATKKIKNSLSEIIPKGLIEKVLKNSEINKEKICNSVTRDERMKLIKNIKDLRCSVKKLLGEDKAIITSGGVILEEIDFKTMQSKLYPNLYLVGDILNIDRPSGGYSLQLCWTTGFVAGDSIKSI